MAKPKDPKPKGKSKRGGPRPFSGRKPTEFNQLRKDIIEAFHAGNVEYLPKALENLIYLAGGGYERVEEKHGVDDQGLFVLTERKVSVAEPDRAANQYLIDRILGRPRQSVEVTDADDTRPKRIVVPDADDRSTEDQTG